MTLQTNITNRSLFLRECDIEALPPYRWLIKNVLPASGIALLYAKPGEGKSFLAIDLAEGIAHGTEAWGHKFEPGTVVYVVAEGFEGLGKRMEGWRSFHGNIPAGNNFIAYPQAVNFREAGEVSKFIEGVRHELLVQKNLLRLLVIDTLSQNFGGGDENSQAAMSAFVGNIQTIVAHFGCLALVLHHTSRSSPESTRGSSVADGAADAMLLVSQQGDGQLVTVTKQKEGESGGSLFFERHVIPIDSNDIEETTLVMQFRENRGRLEKAKNELLGAKQILAHRVLVDEGRPLTEQDWLDAFRKAGGVDGVRGRKSFFDAKATLIKRGIVLEQEDSTGVVYIAAQV